MRDSYRWARCFCGGRCCCKACRAEHNAAALASRISADCHAAASLVAFSLPDTLQSLLVVCGGLGYLAVISGRMTAQLSVAIALLCIVSVRCEFALV